MPEKAVEQARITLTALGDERASDTLVVVRYKSLVQPDGGLLYGTVVVEVAACKNGKYQQVLHLAEVQETAPACPPDWGALRVRPEAIELWSEAPDRIHERRLFERDGDGWAVTLLSP